MPSPEQKIEALNAEDSARIGKQRGVIELYSPRPLLAGRTRQARPADPHDAFLGWRCPYFLRG